MMWEGSYGSGIALWMIPMMILVWGGFIALIVLMVRALSGSVRPKSSSDSSLEILRTRLANGQITPEEFEKTRQILQK